MPALDEASPAPIPADTTDARLTGFWSLIAVQFQGAFSDNALKWLVSYLVLESAFSKETRDLWFVLIVPLLFAVPFCSFRFPAVFWRTNTANAASRSTRKSSSLA